MAESKTDLIIIKQEGFASGVNLVNDPVHLSSTELSDSQNVLPISDNEIEQINGYTQFNNSVIGAAVGIRAIYQFKNTRGTYYPVCQCDDGKIYVGSAGLPATGSWTSILTETASADIATFTDVAGQLVMTNGVDTPQVYEGAYGRVKGCLLASGTSYYDYLTVVSDENSSTFCDVGGMGTTEILYIGSNVPKLIGIRAELNTAVNVINSTVAVAYWNGAAWAAVSGLYDGTATDPGGANNRTLGKSGDITFTEATTQPVLISEQYRYWFKITVSATITASVQITAIYLMYNMQSLQTMWDGVKRHSVDCRKTVDGSTYTDYTSNVADGDTTTGAALGALDTLANGDWFYITYTSKFIGVYITMGSDVNTNDATLTSQYFSNTTQAWAALTNTNGTMSGAHTLGQSGYIWWAAPTDWRICDPGGASVPGYSVRFSVSAALSATVLLAEVDIIPLPETLGKYHHCLAKKNRLLLANIDEAPYEIDISAENNITDFSGTDTDYQMVPTGQAITALKDFYNEVLIGTQDSIYLLQGYSPANFGLLHVLTQGTGPANNHCIVDVENGVIYFHASGFWFFDGTQATCISNKIACFFDPANTTYYIPVARYAYVQGRKNGSKGIVEWTVSKGAVATNNLILAYRSPKTKEEGVGGWFINSYIASSVATVQGTTQQELYYHGDYLGRIHRDDYGTTFNGAAITSYITTRGFSIDPSLTSLAVFRGIRIVIKAKASGSLTITYALNGASSSSSLSTMTMIGSTTYIMGEIMEPLVGSSITYTITNSTSAIKLSIGSIQIPTNPVRIGFIV